MLIVGGNMEISDFKLVDVIGTGPVTWKYRASVTVTKKNIFRKPTVERRNIFKTYTGSWYFTDTGEFTPLVVNELVRKLESETGKNLEGCLNV